MKKSKQAVLGKLLLSSALLASLAVGEVLLQPVLDEAGVQTIYVKADELKNGSVIGQLNGHDVIKSTTNNMSSQDFQNLVDSIVQNKNLTSIKYVADTIQWNANSKVVGVNGTTPTNVVNFGVNVFHWLKGDGFVDGDQGAVLDRGQSLAVTNVGTVTEVETGKKIPVSLVVTYTNSVHGSDDQTTTNAYTAIKNQSGVITIAGATTTSGTVYDPGGATGEGNGGASGGGASGTGYIGYIEEYGYRASLVRSDTGQTISDNELLMAMKVSDIDASQRAALSATGTIAYIVSPDSKLSIGDGGLIASSSDAVNADTTNLSSTSYIALKTYSSNSVNFKYTDGKGNHTTIVTGLFGNTGFKLNADSKGTIDIVKTGSQSGTTMWNSKYTLKGNVFKLTDTKTKKVYTLTTDDKGYARQTDLPFSTYTVEEVTASPGFNKTFKTVTVTLDAKTPKATVNGKDDQLLTVKGTNDEITGKIKIVKKGTESQLAMWNANYTLEGNQFRLTNKENNKVYNITTNAQGEALVEGMQLGEYLVEEISASKGFVRTFKTQTATLDQNGKLELEVTGTNDEIKGQNTLEKVDKDTGVNPQGQAVLKNAEYTLYYADDSTGSSPHKKDTPVKWSDVPNAKLIKGEKARTSIVNGQAVDNRDAIVLNVDDHDLTVAVGNLSVGKYYWKESNATEGYAIDSSKHEFEIEDKDDVTQNIITPNTKSLEQVIKATITIQKIAQSTGDGSSSGINDIEFTATPINGTKGDVNTFKTGIVDNEDGIAKTTLTYGDYKIEETKSPDGYDKIDPIYIHMSYDEKTDLYTITASKNEDGSKPFSSRTFSQSDDKSEKNGNVKGSLAGTLTGTNALISLSKMTFKDNATPPPTPEPPVFQPEKFDLSEGTFDLEGTKLMDDDDELKDEYTDTNKDPYADKTDNNEPQNFNTKTVKRGDTIFYQIWLDTTKLTADQLIQVVGGSDDYDEKNLTIKSVKAYDGKTGDEATQLFDIADKDGKLTFQTKEELIKDNVLDTSKFALGRYYKFVVEAVVKEDVKDDVDIINTASQFVTTYNATSKTTDKPIEKPTQKRVNKVVPNPVFQPEKFDLSEGTFDLKGTKLMDDDDELKDEYTDTNKDPYADKTDNNEPQNLNTKTVKRGDTIFYQVWLDTTKLTAVQLIQVVGGSDDYDERSLAIKSVKAYDGKTGDEATQLFDIADKDGKLTFQTKEELIKDNVLDTSKFALGRYYKFVVEATVKDEAADNVDIINTASQFVTTYNATSKTTDKPIEKPTQKRVNKVVSLTPQPHKFVVDKAAYDVKGTSLLDDDSELKDRYTDTNKDPYADKKDNNDKDNINTDVVKAGTVLHYQVWMDTTPYNKDSLLQTTYAEDDYDERYVTINVKDIKAWNKKTGKDVTDQFDIVDKDGKVTITPKDSLKKDLEQIRVLDTSKFELGVLYQFDIPATVKDDVAANTDIVNTAKQIVVDNRGNQLDLPAEKRVNKTPEATPQGLLPHTGEAISWLLSALGVVLLFGLLEWKTKFFQTKWKNFKK